MLAAAPWPPQGHAARTPFRPGYSTGGPVKHDRVPRFASGSILSKKEIPVRRAPSYRGAAPLARCAGRYFPATTLRVSTLNTLVANVLAIVVAFWMRLSIETYPGIRRSYVIFPSALTGHGLTILWFVLTRFPYDRIGLALGFLLHVIWLYALYVYAERRVRRRFAVVPFGGTERLKRIAGVDWLTLTPPAAARCRRCDAIVADFSRRPARRVGSLPRRRRARRAHRLPGQAAVRIADRPGRARAIVGKQLRLAASGARLFHLKGLGDFRRGGVLPLALPVMAAIAWRSASRARGRCCSARSGSAMPARASPSTSSARCSIARGDETTGAPRSPATTTRRITRVGRCCANSARRASADLQHPQMGR